MKVNEDQKVCVYQTFFKISYFVFKRRRRKINCINLLLLLGEL